MLSQDRRIDLDGILRITLGSNNVYFQPPSSVRMVYPAIRYELSDISTYSADNRKYLAQKEYTLTLIAKDPDIDVVEKLIMLPFTRFYRYYSADNLHHWVFSIYY